MSLADGDLAVFLAVERSGSFGAAARELMVSQPAVSERIRRLERVVGRRLFDRTARGSSITEAGRALVPYAQRCLALADEALEAARSAAGSRALTVAVHSTFAPRVMPMVVSATAGEPRRIVVRDVHSEDVADLVLAGAADIGFALTAGSVRGLRRRPLKADNVICVAAAGHPLAGLRRPSISDLRDTFIAVNAWGDGERAFADLLAAHQIPDWRVRLCGDQTTALTLARDHGHAAFLAESALALLPSAPLLKIDLRDTPRWEIRLHLVHRTSDGSLPFMRDLVSTIRN